MSESQIILLSLPCLPACQPAARVRPCSANTSSRIVCEYPIPGAEIWALSSPSLHLSSSPPPPLAGRLHSGPHMYAMQFNAPHELFYHCPRSPPDSAPLWRKKISYFYGHCNAIKRSCSARSPPLPPSPIALPYQFPLSSIFYRGGWLSFMLRKIWMQSALQAVWNTTFSLVCLHLNAYDGNMASRHYSFRPQRRVH